MVEEPLLETGESVRQFNSRLHREGRYVDFQRACRSWSDANGLTYGEARAEICLAWGALSGGSGDDGIESGGVGADSSFGVRAESGEGPDGSLSDGGPGGVGGSGSDIPSGGYCFGESEEEGGYWESLNWALEAMGRWEAGEQLGPSQSPGPRAWALFTWGRRNKDKFFSHFAGESRKQAVDEEVAGKVAGQKDVEELKEMLRELRSAVLDEQLPVFQRDDGLGGNGEGGG
jgi:hypothetical protein